MIDLLGIYCMRVVDIKGSKFSEGSLVVLELYCNVFLEVMNFMCYLIRLVII